MRSLYWLTAVTLVAAAVTTVAIADYGRRHPQSVAAWWQSPSPNSTTSSCPGQPVSTDDASCCSSTTGTCGVQEKPAVPPAPVNFDEIPEHKQLRDEALKNLASLQPEPPPLPPSSTKAPVVDEFTFNDKPLAPLYVPIQPDAPVVLPPARLMKEVARLPNIPGVSLSHSSSTPSPTSFNKGSFNSMPDYRLEANRGPEVLKGLHAVRPEQPESDNPVFDTMMTIGELISALNPATYLMSMPMTKKAATPTSFATPESKPAPAAACDDKHTTCPDSQPTLAGKPACNKEGTCCRNAATADDVVVRTYSIAEFMSSTGTRHDELIRLITTMVAPESWSTRDSNIEFFPLGKCLVVRHRNSVQDQVDDLLTQLRTQVVKQNQQKVVAPNPVIHMERTMATPSELELVPMLPSERTDRLPRVITNEPNRCVGDDEFFGMIPMRSDGRLMPVPMDATAMLARAALVPAQFTPRAQEPVLVDEGPGTPVAKPKVPEFFPWFLPYAPLPNGPDSCEEELLNRTGFVSYTDDEIAFLFLMACEREEGVR